MAENLLHLERSSRVPHFHHHNVSKCRAGQEPDRSHLPLTRHEPFKRNVSSPSELEQNIGARREVTANLSILLEG